MSMLNPRLFIPLLLMLSFCIPAHAVKYAPINEIPGKVPETEEEANVWKVGLDHQEKVRGTDALVNDAALEQYIEGVIAGLMGPMVEQIGMEVDVLVFKDPTSNAWVYPNGTVAVQTGLLAALENEAQLSAILGHEISHFLNRHAFVQIKSKQTQQMIGKGLGVLASIAVSAETGQVNTDLMGAGQIYTDLVTSGYSRKLETAADQQGLELMIAAGYPPDQALPAFETMRIADDDIVSLDKMWSSHPDIDSRKKNLAKQIKKSEAEHGTRGLDEETYLRGVRLAVFTDSQLQIARGKIDLALRQQKQFAAAETALRQYLELAPSAADGPIIEWYLDNLTVAAGDSQ